MHTHTEGTLDKNAGSKEFYETNKFRSNVQRGRTRWGGGKQTAATHHQHNTCTHLLIEISIAFVHGYSGTII